MGFRVAAVAAATLALGGCATITRGTSDQIQITSEPSGIRATTSMGYSCTTPCTLTVSRKDEFAVKFDAPGYDPQEIQVKTGIAGAGAAGFAGNVILGGVVGMAADAATGATLEHIPNPVHADLQPIAVAPAAPQIRGTPPARRAPPKPAPGSQEPEA
ncbi:hypothetical protein SAMN05519103_03954 [Rhizobiales bacterium GAS113]|nr:hypothetical protein SAMN05519103_03954 [Rhizobiales bacterium GAS113]